MTTRRQTLAALTLTAALVGLAASPATAAQVLIEGTAYNTSAFPNFVESSLTNATTRAWNLGPAAALDQTLNGIALDGPDDGGYDNGLTLSAVSTFSGSFLNWTPDPQTSAKNNISNTGVFTVSPESWTADITATAGKRYIVEVNSNPVNSTNVRSLDVTVDGTLYADNLAVPSGGGNYSVVYRFAGIADADGIDLTFDPGADNDTNPYATALSVTEIARVPRLLSVDIASALRATVATQTGAVQYKADLNAAGQNGTSDQIGVWDNGAAPVNFWNYTGFSADEFTLVDADGKLTPVWMTTNTTNTASNWTSGSPNDDLVSDGVFHSDPTTLVTTIGGLTAGDYVDLLVYHSDNFLSELVTVNGVSAVDYTGAMAHPYGDAFDGLADSDFWYFKSIRIDSLGRLVILTNGDSINTITGFQLIAVPTPAALPAGFALLGLLTVRRRR